MSNIAEGFERRVIGQFRHFLIIAKASCAEVRSQLHTAFDAGYLDEETCIILQEQADEASRIIHGLRLSHDRQQSPPG